MRSMRTAVQSEILTFSIIPFYRRPGRSLRSTAISRDAARKKFGFSFKIRGFHIEFGHIFLQFQSFWGTEPLKLPLTTPMAKSQHPIQDHSKDWNFIFDRFT